MFQNLGLVECFCLVKFTLLLKSTYLFSLIQQNSSVYQFLKLWRTIVGNIEKFWGILYCEMLIWCISEVRKRESLVLRITKLLLDIHKSVYFSKLWIYYSSNDKVVSHKILLENSNRSFVSIEPNARELHTWIHAGSVANSSS